MRGDLLVFLRFHPQMSLYVFQNVQSTKVPGHILCARENPVVF
jgi:hypothetical protein